MEFPSIFAAIFQHKLELFNLLEPLGLQKVEAPRISRQSAHKCGKVVSPTHRPPLPPGNIPGTHFC
jgi:hypothetical protein